MYSIILIAVSMAMDAFAVSISLGLAINHNYNLTALKTGLSFGLFQSIMALLGWLLGCSLKRIIDPIDHWIAFILLSAIGINFIKESKHPSNTLSINSLRVLFTLSLATSIDAFATGVTFSLLKVNIIIAVCLIGQITYCASVIGVYIGKSLRKNTNLQSCVNILGGTILIIIGVKILITHLINGI
ncbi:manganese efflux pump MntP [Vallitalea longa]|uniref:manganese efflux pump MntP n=1 Tax=Vallitalea longa TaxID=2936439 RepID=UPI00248FBA05|nr:manganese efflux pump [Vallitalea longa]